MEKDAWHGGTERWTARTLMLSQVAWLLGCIGAPAFAIVLLVTPVVTGSPVETSPSEILLSPQSYDGKLVTLTGKVIHLTTVVSRRGQPYYTFDLFDGVAAIRIFSFGSPLCPTGATAVVEGTFKRMNQAGRHTFYNQVDAVKVTCW